MAIFVLRPAAIGNYDLWALGAGTTKPLAADPGDPVSHDDAASYITKVAPGANALQSFTLGTRPSISALNSISLIGRARISNTAESISLFARMNGVDGTFSQVTFTTANTWETKTVTPNRPGGGSWTLDDIFNSTLEVGVFLAISSHTADCTSLYFQIDAPAAGGTIKGPKQRATRQILHVARGPATINGIAPLFLGDVMPSDLVSVTDETGPRADGLGWGRLSSERRPILVTAKTLDLNSLELALDSVDGKGIFSTLAVLPITDRAATLADDGAGFLHSGAVETYTRSGNAWTANAAAAKAGAVQYLQIAADIKKWSPGGLVMERAATNSVLNSIAKDGIASNWTNSGVTADTADLAFFDNASAALSAQSWKLTRTAGSGGQIRSAVVSHGASTNVFLSVLHKDDSGLAMRASVQDTVDNFWWNFGTKTWQSATTSVTLPVRTAVTMDHVGYILTRSGAPTLAYQIDADAAANQTNHVYYVGAPTGRWGGSPIVTQASAVTRNVEVFSLSNNSGVTVLNAPEGTALLTFIPNWNSADTGGFADFFMWRVLYDANNDMLLSFGTGGAFVFQVKVGGVTFTATRTETVTIGTVYKLAVRWTATTASIFVNGVKGTDATLTSGPPAQTTTATLYLGLHAAGSNMEGTFAGDVRFHQWAWTDEEIVGAHSG